MIVGDCQEFSRIGDRTLLDAIVSMAERETLTANMRRSAILGSLAPIQWLVQRSRGEALTLKQAIELDDLLHGFCGNGEHMDFMLGAVLVFLKDNDDRIAQMIADWQEAEQGYYEQYEGRHAVAA